MEIKKEFLQKFDDAEFVRKFRFFKSICRPENRL